jgi:DNA-binding Lrp family transcriptional regulator
MASAMKITEAELLNALAAAAPGKAPREAKTLTELSEETEVSPLKVQRALKEYQKQGRLVAHRVQRMAIDGTQRQVPAYTILPKK